MDIFKRLFQVLLWIGFVGFALGLFIWIGVSLESFFYGYQSPDIDDAEGIFLTIATISYGTIVVIRWILFKEWIFLPWKKASTKED